MLKNSKFLFIVSLVAAGSMFLFPLVTRAITAGGVGVSPARPKPDVAHSDIRFIYNLDRGESVEDAIKLVNFSPEKSMFVKIYPVDAVVSPKGVFNPLAETDPKTGIGAWIEMSELEVTLEPEETREVSFTLTIPEDAAVGDHIGAIVAEKGELDATSQPGLSIKTRVAIRVFNTVPGEIIRDLQISKVSWEIQNKELGDKATTGEKIRTILGLNKQGFITLELKNQGNTHLMPMANIEITDIFGGFVETLENVSLGSSALGQMSTVPVKWLKPSLFGRFTAKIIVFYGDNQTVEVKKSFWIVPWVLIFIFVVLLVVFVFARLFWRLYYAKKKMKMSQYKVGINETLPELAEKFNIKWKKLARINRLKAPYTLKQGQILFVPKR